MHFSISAYFFVVLLHSLTTIIVVIVVPSPAEMDRFFHVMPERVDIPFAPLEWLDDEHVFMHGASPFPFFRIVSPEHSSSAIVAGLQKTKSLLELHAIRDDYWSLHVSQERSWQTVDRSICAIHCFTSQSFRDQSSSRDLKIRITTKEIDVANLVSENGYEFRGLCWNDESAKHFRSNAIMPARRVPPIVVDKMAYIPSFFLFSRAASLKAYESVSESSLLLVDGIHVGFAIPKEIFEFISHGVVEFNDDCWFGYLATDLFGHNDNYYRIAPYKRDIRDGGRYVIKFAFACEALAKVWLATAPQIRIRRDIPDVE